MFNKYHHKKRGTAVSTINIKGKTYTIRLTDHAALRLNQRNIDLYQVISSILSLGEQRLNEYSNSDRDIFIQDKTNNFSIVIYINKGTIYVITCIDHIDCFIKSNTTVINL